MKLLVVNADDFGFTRGVNAGIVEAHHQGILTSTTLMAPGAAFDDAVRLAKENPTLDVGVHIVLVDLDGFPRTIAEFARAVAFGRFEIYEAVCAQIRRVLDAGLKPTHLDTHKHTHLLPPVLASVGRASQEFGIPWVRKPFGPFRLASPGVLARRGCRTTDHFAGFSMTGKFDENSLAALIRNLREGSTEFMCHPGLCTDELRSAQTRLKESRERELRALTSSVVRRAVNESGVKVVSYRDFG